MEVGHRLESERDGRSFVRLNVGSQRGELKVFF